MLWSRRPLCGKPAGCLPPGTLGQWLPAPCNGGPSTRAATRKPTRRGRLGPRAGIPKRKLPNCQKQKGTLESAWAASTQCKKKGPENPGVVAPLADAGCRGNRRYVTFGRSHTSEFSSPSRATLSGPSTPQILWVLYLRLTVSCLRLHPVFRKLLSLGRRCLARAQQGLLRQVPRWCGSKQASRVAWCVY